MQTVNAVLMSFENVPVSCQFLHAMLCFSKHRVNKNDWGYRFSHEHFSLIWVTHTSNLAKFCGFPQPMWVNDMMILGNIP